MAVKHIEILDRPTKQRLKIAFEKLPFGDIRKLKDYQNDYRLRVGNFRVLFSMKDDIKTIKDVLPRGQAYKRLQEENIMKKEVLKNLIDQIDEQDTETIFRVLIRFVPEDAPLPDEIEAITRANESIKTFGTVSHEDVNWQQE